MTETISTQNREEEGSIDRVLLAAVRAVQSGDEQAFDTVMIRTERRVAGLAWNILRDSEEVRDALQETFLRAYRFIGRYDPERAFLPWIFRITVNVCRDLERARRGRRNRFAALADVHAAPDRLRPDVVADRNQKMEFLKQAIDQLPRKERLAIVLRDIEGLSTAEVAAILGSRAATVRVQISSARSKIRSYLHERRGGNS